MSEEKLYMVKNDEGYCWDFNNLYGLWKTGCGFRTVTVSEDIAKNTAKEHGGHVVTLIEEPKKVVLPKKAAEWIDSVKDGGYDITYIFTEYAMPNEVSDWLEDSDDDAEHREERGIMLINAYLYGYTVAKEKKYYVKVFKSNFGYLNVNYVTGRSMVSDREQLLGYRTQFTKSEIKQLEQRDDIPLDWDKVKLIEVEK